jgi:DUF917 family protein/Asp/Glu/hydantoin racemase
MAQTYLKDDIVHVLKGAAFLGAGGGGSMEYGLGLLDELESKGYDIQFRLLSVDEMDETKYAGMVAALGQPTSIDPVKLADDLPGAYKALQIACAADGNDLQYLYSGEMGGFNTMVPIFLSIVSNTDPKLRIPILDVDANGRAVPALDTCLASARGIPPSPLGMAGHKNEEPQYRYISWPEDAADAEALARALGGGWYDLIGFSTWAMSKGQIKQNACENYISYARRIGEALDNTAMPLYDALHSVIPKIKEFFSGKIVDVVSDSGSGFDKGTVVIADPNGSATIGIKFQNESLYVGKYDGKIFSDICLTIPELISMVDTNTRKPLTNDNEKDIIIGQFVTVFLSPAHYFWWDAKNAYESFRGTLNDNGYTGPFIKYNPLFEKNRISDAAYREMYLQVPYAGEDQHLEDILNAYLSQNIYSDSVNYFESFTPKGYFTVDEDEEEPTVTERDIVLKGPKLLQLIAERYKDNDFMKPWAGHLVSRFGDDKTVRALREATSRSIFDAFDPAILLSLALAEKSSILTWPTTMAPILERRIGSTTLEKRIVSVRAIAGESMKTILQELLAAAQLAIDEDGAQAIIIGRSYYPGDGSYDPDYDLASQLQSELSQLPGYDVPVVDANRVAARWIEMCVHMGYFHSRLSYYVPPKKSV